VVRLDWEGLWWCRWPCQPHWTSLSTWEDQRQWHLAKATRGTINHNACAIRLKLYSWQLWQRILTDCANCLSTIVLTTMAGSGGFATWGSRAWGDPAGQHAMWRVASRLGCIECGLDMIWHTTWLTEQICAQSRTQTYMLIHDCMYIHSVALFTSKYSVQLSF